MLAGFLLLAAVNIDVTVDVRGGFADPAAIKAVVVAKAISDSTVRRAAVVDGRASLSLESGPWSVTTEADGHWSPERFINVSDASTALDLPVYPAARLNARIQTPRGKALPASMTLTMQSAPDVTDARTLLPNATVVCPVTDGRIDCAIPAIPLDFNLRVPGYVSHFFWDRRPVRGKQLDLGTLRLREGSTLVGSVLLRTKTKHERITVTLSPMAAGDNDEERNRRTVGSMSVTPSARGFFQFVAEPGSYVVQARAGRLISGPTEVTILAGRQAELREPLVLTEPLSLRLSVDPPTDPWGKPWRIELTRADATGVVLSDVAARTDAGICGFTDLVPGTYLWRAQGASGTWAMGELELAEDSDRRIAVPLHWIEGKVTLDQEPVAATVIFGGRHGVISVGAKSGEDGRYRAILPVVTDDRWPVVEVESKSAQIRRVLHDVRIERPADASEAATLDIELPSTSFIAEVVDEAGVAQRDVLLNLVDSAGTMQQLESESGVFLVTGLPPGRTVMRAESPDGQSERPTEIDLRPETTSEPQQVRIVVAPRSFFDLIVRSESGPLGSARVCSGDPDDSASPYTPMSTDVEGRLRMAIRPRAHSVNLAVHAPGYGFRIARVATRSSGVPMLVAPFSGALTVACPRIAEGRLCWLIHQGAAFSAGVVEAVSGAISESSTSLDRLHFTIPQAEEGAYALCLLAFEEVPAAAAGNLSAERCVSGHLPRFGSLSLTLPR